MTKFWTSFVPLLWGAWVYPFPYMCILYLVIYNHLWLKRFFNKKGGTYYMHLDESLRAYNKKQMDERIKKGCFLASDKTTIYYSTVSLTNWKSTKEKKFFIVRLVSRRRSICVSQSSPFTTFFSGAIHFICWRVLSHSCPLFFTLYLVPS